MNTDRIQLVFFLIMFAAIAILAFFVFLPFLPVIATAIIFAVVLEPLYEWVLPKVRNQKSVAAGLVVCAITVLILTFVSLIITNIFNESRDAYDRIAAGEANYLSAISQAIEVPLQRFIPEFTFDLRNYADGIIDFVRTYATRLLSTTASTLFYLFLGVVAFFFFLRDGKEFRNQLISISPLKDELDEYVFKKMKSAINAVVKGTLMVAIVQGLLVGIGLAIFGVPNPTLWGSFAVISAIIPGVGTAIVGIPAIAYLVFQGLLGSAIGLAIWQVALVGLIDNVLAPYLYGRGTNIHPVIILFSVLGGLAFFGPIGFLFGPLVVALLFVLLHVYRVVVLQADKDHIDNEV